MNNPKKHLIHHAEALIRAELSTKGWLRRSRNVFTKKITADATAWVGLGEAKSQGDGLLHLYPAIGVSFGPIELLLAELSTWRRKTAIHPTISQHIGYCMPRNAVAEWVFADDEDTIGKSRD